MSQEFSRAHEPASIREYVEKTSSAYSHGEVVYIRQMFKDARDLSEREVADISTIAGKPLSVFELSHLHGLFPQKTLRSVRDFLLDEEGIRAYIDEAAKKSAKERQRFWHLFAVLPLPQHIQEYIFRAFLTHRLERDGQELKEAHSEEEVEAWTPVRSHLAMTAQPHLDQYLETIEEKGGFSLPQASVFLLDKKSDEVHRITLTEQETAASLAYAHERLDSIARDREKLTEKYRTDQGLSTGAEIPYTEVNFHYTTPLSVALQSYISTLLKNEFLLK